MSDIVIVPMTESDVPQIVMLEQRCFSDPWSEASISSELRNVLSLWLVARSGETVAGYVGSQSVPPESDVMNLAVAPEFRRQGLGRRLMTAMTDALRARDIEALTLEVRVSNEPARALYQALGFVQVGRRPRYYVRPVEDALILRKELRDADSIN